MLRFKVCVIGSYGVGKTSLVRRFTHSLFDERYLTTVGVRVDSKVLRAGEDDIELMLWDLAGEDEYARLNLAHLRGMAGYLLVADGTRASTLETAVQLQCEVESRHGQLPFSLLLNKADLKSTVWEADEIRLPERWVGIETSAKTGDGVEAAFLGLAERLRGA